MLDEHVIIAMLAKMRGRQRRFLSRDIAIQLGWSVNKVAKLMNKLSVHRVLKYGIFVYKSKQRSRNFVREYEWDKGIEQELFAHEQEKTTQQPESLFMRCLLKHVPEAHGRIVRGRSSLEEERKQP